MSDAKAPAIKLFGKTIPVLGIMSGCGDSAADYALSSTSSPSEEEEEEDESNRVEEEREVEKGSLGEKVIEAQQGNEESQPLVSEERTEPDTSSVAIELMSETSTSQEKALKKADKLLPCPRCNSAETKFCYYNNYNVNQPRYFCKSCQRYWTAGGAMRDVPIGAGRRKNKNLTSHSHQVTVSEARQNSPNDIATANGFGSDAPLSESMTSFLNPAENREARRVPVPRGSQVINSNPKDSLTGSPWHHAWNVDQWTYPTGFSAPFYPSATYWGCRVPRTCNSPWISQPAPSSGSKSSTLGKHSRGGSSLKERDSEKCFWVPQDIEDR